MVDPRTPVLIGAGQFSNRVDQGAEAVEPADLIVEAVRRAADDTGVGMAAVTGADTVHAVRLISWRYRDVARLVAERIGATPRDTAVSSMSGNSPQTLTNKACLAIQAGEADLVIIGGAEAWRTHSAFRARNEQPDWTVQGDDVPAARAAMAEMPMSGPAEQARGIFMPVQVYPMFEQAYRLRVGRTVDEHRVALAELWSRFSEVAATNPHAWIQEAFTPEEIGTPSAQNRMIGSPYTKRMNSNNAVEQGAAFIVCSAERATELGVSRDRWVFPHSGTDAHDHFYMSDREHLGASPAMRLAGRAALDLAGVSVDELGPVDVYSCFPSAVQIAALEIGLDLDRPLTVTGGLSFAGGPWNNYVSHSIAAMVGALRAAPGERGLITANGGFITKHAFGVYSTEPPAEGFRHRDLQAEVDALPTRDVCDEPDGVATPEAWTVMHDRDGNPETGILAALLPDGRRAWGSTQDPDITHVMATEELADRKATLRPDGTFDLN